jgi:arylformamidase
MKIYDLSQPLNADCSFWPFYPPFEVKYIKRKAEHGVNAQYIATSNHMGTHLDAPRHFVTKGKTIDQLPIEWLYGPGVIVDLSDALDDLDVFTPEMIEQRAEVREGDILFIHTGWHKYSFLSPEADEERYIHRHPGPHHSLCDWLLSKKIHVWGVDMISTDHPMNLPIGRFLGRGGLEHWQKVRRRVEEKFDRRAVPGLGLPAHAQRALPPRLRARGKPRRRHWPARAAQQAHHAGRVPLEVPGRRGGVLPRRCLARGVIGNW